MLCYEFSRKVFSQSNSGWRLGNVLHVVFRNYVSKHQKVWSYLLDKVWLCNFVLRDRVHAVVVYVVQHCANLRNNFSANLWRNLSINMEWGEPNLGFFLTYSRKINVSFTSMLQGFDKTTTFMYVGCVIYKFTIKGHRRASKLQAFLLCN